MVFILVLLFVLTFPTYCISKFSLDDINNLQPWANPNGRYGQNIEDVSKLQFNHWLFRKKGMQQIFDGYPYLFKNPRTGVEAFFCLCEKVGSTAWKAFLIKAMNLGHFKDTLSKRKDVSSHNYVPSLPVYGLEDFQKKLNDSSIPRFMFVRNPYSRIVSGWTEKTSQQYYATFNRSKGFDEFVYHMRDNRFGVYMTREINDHFHPLTSKCMLNAHMTYDYFLKVEQMDYWYAPLVRLLQLEPEASEGWSAYHAHHHGDPSHDCFHVPHGDSCATALGNKTEVQSCEGLIKLRTKAPTTTTHVVTTESRTASTDPMNVTTTIITTVTTTTIIDRPDTNEPTASLTNSNSSSSSIKRSANHLAEYFSNRELIAAVNLYADEDFKQFGYHKETGESLESYKNVHLEFKCSEE